jgi:hypothetical protein
MNEEQEHQEREAARKKAAEKKRQQKDAARDQALQEVALAEKNAHEQLQLAQQQATAVQSVGGENSTQTAVMGRPSEYTDEEADRICAWIAEGRSLRSYCRLEHRGLDTVYRWLRERKDFRERYARAHDDRADSLADEIVDIADEAATGSMEEIQAARLRVDARKWVASKLKPTKWGDYQGDTAKTNVIFNIGIRSTHSQPPTIDCNPAPVLGSRPGTESGPLLPG